MISNDEKKKILHRRWAITAFIAVIFITAMELWSIVFAIFFYVSGNCSYFLVL